jgi:hypothetical protein
MASEDSAMVDGLVDAMAGAVMLVMTGAKAQSHPARPTPSITTPAAHPNVAVGIMQDPRRCSNRTIRHPSLKNAVGDDEPHAVRFPQNIPRWPLPQRQSVETRRHLVRPAGSGVDEQPHTKATDQFAVRHLRATKTATEVALT